MWPSEPQLIDDIAVLIQTRLATCSACDEFGPQVSKHLHNTLSVVEQQRSSNVVGEADRMSNKYSPVLHEAASQQPHFHKAGEYSNECPEVPSEFVSLDLEPVVSRRAQPFHIIHSSDMLHEIDVASKRLSTGHPNPHQDGLKATAKLPPEPWFIDNVPAHPIYNKFGSCLPNYPPDELPGMDK